MTVQELKNSILQYAVQGKLVPQDPNDEPASELLKRINTEKQQLIKEKKIKAEKALQPINEEDIPFELPESWVWVKLGEVISLNSGQDLLPSQYSDTINSGIPYITGASNIDNGNILINRWTNTPKSIAYKGDLLLTCKGTVGKIAFLELEKVHIARQIMSIKYFIIEYKYIHYVLTTQIEKYKQKANSFIPGIDRSIVLNTLFPLPPLAEQQRIVDKIEELMPMVEEYDKAEKELTGLNKAFPEQIKKSILQYAIQGKLVSQNPQDEPASALLAKIKAEKAQLIIDKKIKAEKPLPPITEEEKPFEIPESWEWVKLGEIGTYRKGPFGSSLTKSMFVPKGDSAIKVYEQKNAIYKNHLLGDYYIKREYFEAKMKSFEVNPNDIIVSCAGTIGETYIIPEGIEKGIINQALMIMKISNIINVDYFLLYFDYILKKTAQVASNGSAIKNIPPFEVFKNLLLPLPPLSEQKLIVEKVEELLAVCEKLQGN